MLAAFFQALRARVYSLEMTLQTHLDGLFFSQCCVMSGTAPSVVTL